MAALHKLLSSAIPLQRLRRVAGVGRSLLDEIVRDGARQMLTAALLAEVAAYIERFADQVDEACHRLVVRNGYHQQREQILGPPLGDIDAMPAEYLKLGRHIANRGYCRPKRSCG
jgi:hypothetical protein